MDLLENCRILYFGEEGEDLDFLEALFDSLFSSLTGMSIGDKAFSKPFIPMMMMTILTILTIFELLHEHSDGVVNDPSRYAR